MYYLFALRYRTNTNPEDILYNKTLRAYLIYDLSDTVKAWALVIVLGMRLWTMNTENYGIHYSLLCFFFFF